MPSGIARPNQIAIPKHDEVRRDTTPAEAARLAADPRKGRERGGFVLMSRMREGPRNRSVASRTRSG